MCHFNFNFLLDRINIIELEDRVILKDRDFEKINISITKRNFNGKIDNVFLLNQVHSDVFYFISDKQKISFNCDGDGIITNLKNFPIGVKTADCLPIFIYSSEKDIIAVCHAGWRGTAKKILEKMLHFLTNYLQLEKKYLNFILGVSICEQCYEIKEDMKREFLKEYGLEGNNFFINNKFDLKKANIALLLKNNIKEEQIFNLKKCTICNNSEFFSFRREKTEKRILNIIEITEG